MQEFLLLMKHELSLIAILVILLILKIRETGESSGIVRTMSILWLLNCLGGWFFNSSGQLFGHMFVNNELFAFEKNILNTGVLIIFLMSESWLKKNEHVYEFYMLCIASLLGMFYMISSGNILMFYLSLELSSIPLAALCNWNLKDRRSSEAGMKMIFSSAFASGLMLMGISLLYGAIGSFDFQMMASNPVSSMLYIPGFIFFFSGLAFKLSVVPFHFWTADVYEGAPSAVTAFLSVISKGATVFVLATVLYHVFRVFSSGWYLMLCMLSVASMVVGNLFAIRQISLQRFMAFSSIAQVGFILVGISGSSNEGMASSIYFVLVYLFSNLAAFAVIGYLKDMKKETIDDCRGLSKSNPLLAWTFAIALFSLAGIPPTAGFFGKLFLLKAGASTGNYVLILIAAANMIVSLYYYLRIIKAIFIDDAGAVTPFRVEGAIRFAIFICMAGVILTGFFGVLYNYIYSLSSGL